MIAPDMATMLCFIFTDAAIAAAGAAERCWRRTCSTTFNCMTIDGDTSTSDTCLLFATGAAAKRGQHADRPTPATRGSRPSAPRSHDLMRELAIQVAKDGEGLSQVRHHRDRRRGELGGGAPHRPCRAPTRRC